MIKIGKVSEMNQDLYDENWMIVRKPKEIPDYVKLEPLLAPSQELFDKYRAVYRAGKYTQEHFDQVYVPQFLEELARNEDALKLLNELVSVSGEKDILLTCFCENETMCHRSIIAGVLLGMGAKIETDPVYLIYFDRLKNIRESEE